MQEIPAGSIPLYEAFQILVERLSPGTETWLSREGQEGVRNAHGVVLTASLGVNEQGGETGKERFEPALHALNKAFASGALKAVELDSEGKAFTLQRAVFDHSNPADYTNPEMIFAAEQFRGRTPFVDESAFRSWLDDYIRTEPVRLSGKFETECTQWLAEFMRASPDKRTHTQDKLLGEVKVKWPSVSARGFTDRVWPDAIKLTGAHAWRMGGRPRRQKEKIAKASG